MNIEDQRERFDTCEHRTPEKILNKVDHCCGRVTEVLEFWCEAKKRILDQPICWNCEFYKKKI